MTENLVATQNEFAVVIEADEANITQQIVDANKKALALRPSALSSHSNAPCFVRIQELQETFEKQLKQQTELSQRKLHELCQAQQTEFANLYAKEHARLTKILNN